MWRADIAGRGVEQVMGREVQKAAVELDIGTYAGDDDAFEIIVADFFGNPLEVVKGAQVTGQEVFCDLRGEKLDIEHPAEGQDHEEAVKRSVADPAGVGPIHLGLFPGQGLDMEEGFFFAA